MIIYGLVTIIILINCDYLQINYDYIQTKCDYIQINVYYIQNSFDYQHINYVSLNIIYD